MVVLIASATVASLGVAATITIEDGSEAVADYPAAMVQRIDNRLEAAGWLEALRRYEHGGA
jgi:hypothetical protein